MLFNGNFDCHRSRKQTFVHFKPTVSLFIFSGQKKEKINNEFYTVVEHALKQSGEDKDFINEYIYEVKLKLMGDRNELVQKERTQIKQRLDNAKQQYIQLETNMDFFTKSSSENPLVAKVMKDLEKQKKIIEGLEKKLKAFKRL